MEEVTLVLTDRYELFRTYIEKQYGRYLSTGERSVVVDGRRYSHGYFEHDVMGLDRQTTTVVVLYGGRDTQAYRACLDRFNDIRYREA